jgi:hypothetical protein
MNFGMVNRTEEERFMLQQTMLIIEIITDASKADRAITSRIIEALGLVDVRLLDHFIIGD